MRVDFHDDLRRPESRRASRVVIYDAFGNAVATFLQLDERNIDIRVRGQKGFDEALLCLGIRQTCLTDVVEASRLPVIRPD